MGKADYVRWHKIMAGRGWAAPSWPIEWGGTGWTATQKHIFDDECARAGTPQVMPFGVAIGKFQVLQHKAVEMFMETEQARSLALLASVKVDSEDANERARTMHAAKARVGRAAKFVGQTAIQLHGGMGMTNELPVGHYFKRLAMIEATLGDTDHHLAAFAALADAA